MEYAKQLYPKRQHNKASYILDSLQVGNVYIMPKRERERERALRGDGSSGRCVFSLAVHME